MTVYVERRQLRLEEALPVLAAPPAILRALLARPPTNWLDFREAAAWSPRTVLVHCIPNERSNWIPRASVILPPSEVRRFAPFHQLPPQAKSTTPRRGGPVAAVSGHSRSLANRRGCSMFRTPMVKCGSSQPGQRVGASQGPPGPAFQPTRFAALACG